MELSRLCITSAMTVRSDQCFMSYRSLTLRRCAHISRSQVRQRGLHVDVSHRLTPLSSISFIVSTQRTQGDLASQESTLNSLSTTWSTRTGPRSTLSAGARWVDFDSNAQPYVERALFANLRLQF